MVMAGWVGWIWTGRPSPFLRGWAAAGKSGGWTATGQGTTAGGGGAKSRCNSGIQGVFEWWHVKLAAITSVMPGYSGYYSGVELVTTTALPHFRLCHDKHRLSGRARRAPGGKVPGLSHTTAPVTKQKWPARQVPLGPPL